MLIINYNADEFSIANVIQLNILMRTDFIFMMMKCVGLATVGWVPEYSDANGYQNTMVMRTDFLAMMMECLFTRCAVTKSCDCFHD